MPYDEIYFETEKDPMSTLIDFLDRNDLNDGESPSTYTATRSVTRSSCLGRTLYRPISEKGGKNASKTLQATRHANAYRV